MHPLEACVKITWKEIRELEDFVQRAEDGNESRYVSSPNAQGERDVFPWWFFAEHPHLLMPMGFDEYLALGGRSQFEKLWFAKEVEDTPQSLYRRPNGQWLLLFAAPHSRDGELFFHSKATIHHRDPEVQDEEGALRIPMAELFSRLYSIADQWQTDRRTIWGPKLWTPNAQKKERIALVRSVRDVLSALHTEKIELKEVSWQQLEEIVAELLRANGMEIHVVRTRPQGGRDIIARGELIPGQEPLTIAVEVKHKRLVDRPEVETALWQNRAFPALLFATSGRFTAGVIEEKNLPENQLRLFLKDGVALGDMLKDYRHVLTRASRK